MNQRNYGNVLYISVSQFGMAFSFNFVMVFIPFFIHQISPYSSDQTLIWVGLIMGAASWTAALVSTLWGSLTSRFSPKGLYMKGLLSHSVITLLMGFVTSLPLLLALRILQGVLGGVSTVGLVIVSSSSSREWAARDMAFFQNSLTMGQLLGPPLGALAASTLGYKGTFVSASGLVFVTLLFCYFKVVEVPYEPRETSSSGKHELNRRTLLGWGLCFTTTIQLMFLPSILPNVFEAFNIEQAVALKWAGLVIMAYTATAMVGTYLLGRLATGMNTHRLIVSIGAIGILFQVLLSLSPGIIGFVGIRMLQCAAIAAILPLMISHFSSGLSGKVIGFLNSARFAGNALGPMIGAWILALSNLNWVYFLVAALSLLSLLGFACASESGKGEASQDG